MKISSFEISLRTGKTKQTDIKVDKYVAPTQLQKKARNYNATNRTTHGPFLEKLLIDNEFLAYDRKAKTNDELKAIFLEKYKNNYQLRRRFQRHSESIGNIKFRYNNRNLHAAQEPVYLVSLTYNTFQIPVVSGKEYYKNIEFQEVYRKCVDLKIADPRFIPPELLAELRNRRNSDDPEWAEWTIPPVSWINKFEDRIGREAYNSVHFPVGWTREDTPVDSDL